MAALLFCLAGGLGAAAPLPLLEAELSLYQPGCSSADPDQVAKAVQGASQLLQSRCGIRLKALALQSLPRKSEWCHLPEDSALRSLHLQALVQPLKAAHPKRLALFLLPSAADERLSWALVDQSLKAGCDSPQEARFLPRFGNFFFTDVTWMMAQPGAEDKGPSRASLLVAHEVLHALTQRRHPTGVEEGSVMADHVAAMGPKIGDDWCACARSSPFVRKP
jgi:hypothetical protein